MIFYFYPQNSAENNLYKIATSMGLPVFLETFFSDKIKWSRIMLMKALFFFEMFNVLSANPTKWSNTLKKFVDKS